MNRWTDCYLLVGQVSNSIPLPHNPLWLRFTFSSEPERVPNKCETFLSVEEADLPLLGIGAVVNCRWSS